jgi:hypothetical protein
VVDLATAARTVAADLLADALPRRWNHVQAVARKAAQVSAILPNAERPVLMAAAWLHDIGYAPSVVATGLHALDGARWLARHGADPRVMTLVANHSCATFEADERGLGDELRSEFPGHESALADTLWYADMTTGPGGEDLDVSARLAEIRARYGPDHVITRFWARAEPTLRAAVGRTEARLAAMSGQPM